MLQLQKPVSDSHSGLVSSLKMIKPLTADAVNWGEDVQNLS